MKCKKNCYGRGTFGIKKANEIMMDFDCGLTVLCIKVEDANSEENVPEWHIPKEAKTICPNSINEIIKIKFKF